MYFIIDVVNFSKERPVENPRADAFASRDEKGSISFHAPRVLARADSFLWNDTAWLCADHRGRVSHDGAGCPGDRRWLYVRDDQDGALWSVTFDPVQNKDAKYSYTASPESIVWRAVAHGIEASLRLIVPREEPVELWTITVHNTVKAVRDISLFPFFSIGAPGRFRDVAAWDASAGAIIHDYFGWWHTREDYERLRKMARAVLCIPDTMPASYECSERRFFGGYGAHAPAALRSSSLGNGAAVQEPSVAAMQFRAYLAPRETKRILLLMAVSATDQVDRLKKTWLTPNAVSQAYSAIIDFRQRNAPPVAGSLPDPKLDSMTNTWVVHQMHMMGRTNRMLPIAQARNAIQDILGLMYCDPEKARAQALWIWGRQRSDGFIPHGLPVREGARLSGLYAIEHTDLNVWGPIVLHDYVAETGDSDLLRAIVQYSDGGEADLYSHIATGLCRLLDRRSNRGLTLLGPGDWNDPLNFAGHKGKGESVWLSMAAAYALDQWALIADFLGADHDCERWKREAQSLRQAVRLYAWDGAWFARGTTDAGRWFGVKGDSEGRIYLNPQAWAILSGVADNEQIDRIIDSVNQYLYTPSGPMLLAPAYSRMHDDIGKLSMKPAGLLENGSVYSHAAVFWAYALYTVRKSDEAFKTLQALIPGAAHNTIDRCEQLPTYIPNYFRGTDAAEGVGRSSRRFTTGSAPWFYHTIATRLLGIRPELNGLRIDPQLPHSWPAVTVNRRWRGAHYRITIEPVKGNEKPGVLMNGEPLENSLLPADVDGKGRDCVVKALV